MGHVWLITVDAIDVQSLKLSSIEPHQYLDGRPPRIWGANDKVLMHFLTYLL